MSIPRHVGEAEDLFDGEGIACLYPVAVCCGCAAYVAHIRRSCTYAPHGAFGKCNVLLQAVLQAECIAAKLSSSKARLEVGARDAGHKSGVTDLIWILLQQGGAMALRA